MTPDWKALTPHRPLEPGDARYVDPPHTTATRIAEWILAGGATVLLGGPVGGGKSTELARVATLLREERLVASVSLGRMGNVRGMSDADISRQITQRVAVLALRERNLNLSAELRATLHAKGIIEDSLVPPGASAQSMSPTDLLNLTLREVNRLCRERRICLLIDGLEVIEESEGRGVFRALSQIEDHTDLVVVVPWHVTFDPGRGVAVRDGERLFSIRLPRSKDEHGEVGRQFLRQVLARRLGLHNDAFVPGALSADIPAEIPGIVHIAAVLSGGVPRIFLQLVADGATFARLRKADWPTEVDLHTAVTDQIESIVRSMLPGDLGSIRAAVGTLGTELDRSVKIRLLTTAALLEREDGALEAHPLVEAILAKVTP